jgi:hypothetical protein
LKKFFRVVACSAFFSPITTSPALQNTPEADLTFFRQSLTGRNMAALKKEKKHE